MLRFAILLCIFAVAMSKQLDYKEWQLYKKAFNRKYNNTDDEFRFKIYSRNVKYIKKHNERFERDQVSYSLGINRFTDMTNEEVAKKMNGLRRTNTVRLGSTYLYDKNATLPDTVDWRMKGMVTDVKNQGDCGSCWAFSTTGSLEGQHKRKTGKLLSLSEQNLVDCSFKEGNEGCNGGLQDDAFKYIKDNGGIDTEKAYPYEGIDESCQFKRSKIGATVTGFVDIAQGKEDALKHAVATVGPISVGIDANHQEFMSYRSGVLDIPFCSTTTLDHGVLVVGYGTHKGKDYWLVKNSWGKIWGMKGYVMMSRNRKNQCGIASEASYPLV